MLAGFNAFQIMSLFVAMPFLIGWLWTEPFPFSVAVFGLCGIVYCVMFVIGTALVADAITKDR